MTRALRLPVVLLLAAAGCGLLDPPDAIGFNTYPLENCSYDLAVEIVRDTTRRYAAERFGGIGITWDAEQSNMTLDPVFAGPRRMKLYVHIAPNGANVDVEMFALVESMSRGGSGAIGWANPKQDVPLEQDLYDAFVAALMERQEGAP